MNYNMSDKTVDLEEAKSLITAHNEDDDKKNYDDKLICGCITISKLKSLGVCLFYASCAIMLSLINKSVLSSYNFNYPFCITLFQQVGALVILSILHILGFIKLPNIKTILGKDAIFVSFAFIANTASGFAGLRLVDIPMFLTLRRLTTMFTLLGEAIFLHQYQPASVNISLGVIMLGALIAGYSTLKNNLFGLLFTVGNDILTALYLNFVARFSKNTNIRSYQLMFVNSVLSIPSLLIIAICTGEFSAMLNYPKWNQFGFEIGVFLTSVMGVVMVYATILCSTYNSPVATSVTGNLKDVLLTFIGAIVFKTQMSVTSIIGITVSFLGAFTYSYLKLKK